MCTYKQKSIVKTRKVKVEWLTAINFAWICKILYKYLNQRKLK